MRYAVPALLALAVIACACENEGRSDEARETVVRYLVAVADGSDERGWSLLSSDSRDFLDRDAYEALAQAAEDVEIVPEAIGLVYEDDGAYEFAITFTEPIPPAHAALFALRNEFGNPLACMPQPDVLELGVVIDPVSGPGITGGGC